LDVSLHQLTRAADQMPHPQASAELPDLAKARLDAAMPKPILPLSLHPHRQPDLHLPPER
jgi:hypothetical protein